MTSALQVNPSIMSRSHHGFSAGTTKLPSANDLSLRRHQLGVFSHAGHDSVHHPYSTTYERSHQLKFSPGYHTGEWQNNQRDAPSGATRNETRTNINPTDVDQRAATKYGIATVEPSDAPAIDGSISLLPENAQTHRFVSDYKSTFSNPDHRNLGAPQDAPVEYKRDFKIATHAIPPPICSDQATQEEHQPFSGSGYTTNNAFAFDTLRHSRQLPVSHYKQTFLGPDAVTPPVLGDGSVDPANWRRSNAYLKCGDTMPQVHAANEGAQPWLPTEWESHAKATQRAALEAPKAEDVPTRTIQRPGSVATNQSRRRRIEHSAFSRSERASDVGLGGEHMKLRLGDGGQTGIHHLSTRPHTAGLEAAPFRYHSSHTHRVAPVAQRVGTGIEEAQMIATLSKLRRTDPTEFQYELDGAPRYKSTYNLLHDDKWLVQEEKQANSDGSLNYTMGPKGLRAGFGSSTPGQTEPSTENGGVRNAFETSYMRAHKDAEEEAKFVKAQGKSISRPQDTGYTTNEKPRELLQHRSHTSRGPQERFKITSHLAYQHPKKHAQDLPPAEGTQINSLAPLQSSYAREHTICPVFPAPVYNSIVTQNGRTIVVQAQTNDLHPTVIKALQVKESSGAWAHPLKPEVPL